MSILRVLCVLGTRPEAVELAPVVRALRGHPKQIVCRVCVTAQHREMLDQVLELFGLSPDVDLNVMRPDQSPSQVAAAVFAGLDAVLQEERPDWVLVQGDTTTVMAAAIAAQHRQARVGHVEAGLRTYDRQNPFPEEMNRVPADHASDALFAPTQRARQNLLREGIADTSVWVTGNTVIDAVQWMATQPEDPSTLPSPLLEANRAGRKVILVTAHRRENFGRPLRDICGALRQIAQERHSQIQIVYPMHLNPNVQEPVRGTLAGVEGITLLPPLDYRSLVYVLKRSALVLTDSGGLQEEAPSLGKPVLVLRQVTERPEAVEAGTARVVGTDPAAIVAQVNRLLDDPNAYQAMARAANPYGDGQAAGRIVQALLGLGGQR